LKLQLSPLRDSTGNIIAGIEVARISRKEEAELEYKNIYLKLPMMVSICTDSQGTSWTSMIPIAL